MDSFQLSGAHDTTIENSQIGPALFCDKNTEGVPATRCSNWANFPADWQPVAQWWAATASGGSTGEQLEPYVHDRGNGSDTTACTTNVTLSGDTFKEMQSTNVNVSHTGGLLVDGSACNGVGWNHNLVVDGSKFVENMSYPVEMDAGMDGSTFQNNWFGQGMNALGDGTTITVANATTGNGVGPNSGCRGGAHPLANVLFRFNSSDGYATFNGNADAATLTSCWSNIRMIGNVFMGSTLGGIPCGGWTSAYTGISMDYNSVLNQSCGSHPTSIGALPFVSTSVGSLSFDLASAVATVPQSAGGDYTLSTDFHGAARSATTNEGAVGP
jgi:hypothetical protein